MRYLTGWTRRDQRELTMLQLAPLEILNFMFKNNAKSFYAISVLFVIGFFVYLAGSAFALTISPPRMEVAGNPGTNVEGEIALFNEEEETKTLYSSIQNFEARGESGAPYFLPERTGFATWISVQDSITLEPQERKVVPFTIRIPANAEPGGHFAAIFWSSSPPQVQGGGQVAIGAKLGVLILLRVAGDVEEKGGLLEFKTEEGRFQPGLPIVFAYRFSNDGGDRIKPEGKITIKNIFGTTSAVLDANKGEGNVLPNSSRKLEAIWHSKGQGIGDLTKKEELALFEQLAKEEKKGFFEAAGDQWSNFAFGMYNAKLALTYGQENKTAEDSFRFFVIPWQLLIIIVVLLAIVGFLGFVGLKKYNRWVIAKAAQIQKK